MTLADLGTRHTLAYRDDMQDSVRYEEIARQVEFGAQWGCTWETTCDGMVIPCEKPAVALRWDEQNGGVGAVCKAHAHHLMVGLGDIYRAIQACESVGPADE